ncbi:hypothetical protein SNEBB_002212 [Seison nebaliae]|nr:hypothetical protein SNEBB_002212 [Seison nebaliae]
MSEEQVLPNAQQAMYRRTVRLYDSRQFKRAYQLSKDILRICPQHGETLTMQSLALVNLPPGTYLKKMNQSVELPSTPLFEHPQLVIALYEDRRRRAKDIAHSGVHFNIQSGSCWHVYGLIHRLHQEYEAALRLFKKAHSLDSTNVNILRDLSLLQVHLKNYDGFRETRRQMLIQRPHLSMNWMAFAIGAHISGCGDLACNILEKFYTSKSDNRMSSNEKSRVLSYWNLIILQQGKFEEAIEHLDKYEEHMLDKDHCLMRKAGLNELLGEYDSATYYYEKLFSRNFTNLDCLLKLYELYMRKERTDDDDTFTLNMKRLQFFKEITDRYPYSIHTITIPLKLLSLKSNAKEFEELLEKFLIRSVTRTNASFFQYFLTIIDDRHKLLIVLKQLVHLMNIFLKNNFGETKNDDIVENSGKIVQNLYHMDLEVLRTYFLNDRQPTTFLWLTYFLGNILAIVGAYGFALDLIHVALCHTPTMNELRTLEADILYRIGYVDQSSKAYDRIRRLDTADKYLNSLNARGEIRRGNIGRGEAIISIFTKESSSSRMYMKENECTWWLFELAKHYRSNAHHIETRYCYDIILAPNELKRLKNEFQNVTSSQSISSSSSSNQQNSTHDEITSISAILQKNVARTDDEFLTPIAEADFAFTTSLMKYLEIVQIFSGFLNDKFDFHAYCTKRLFPSAYVQMLNDADRVEENDAFCYGASGALELLMVLYNTRSMTDELKESYKLKFDEIRMKKFELQFSELGEMKDLKKREQFLQQKMKHLQKRQKQKINRQKTKSQKAQIAPIIDKSKIEDEQCGDNDNVGGQSGKYDCHLNFDDMAQMFLKQKRIGYEHLMTISSEEIMKEFLLPIARSLQAAHSNKPSVHVLLFDIYLNGNCPLALIKTYEQLIQLYRFNEFENMELTSTVFNLKELTNSLMNSDLIKEKDLADNWRLIKNYLANPSLSLVTLKLSYLIQNNGLCNIMSYEKLGKTLKLTIDELKYHLQLSSIDHSIFSSMDMSKTRHQNALNSFFWYRSVRSLPIPKTEKDLADFHSLLSQSPNLEMVNVLNQFELWKISKETNNDNTSRLREKFVEILEKFTNFIKEIPINNQVPRENDLIEGELEMTSKNYGKYSCDILKDVNELIEKLETNIPATLLDVNNDDDMRPATLNWSESNGALSRLYQQLNPFASTSVCQARERTFAQSPPLKLTQDRLIEVKFGCLSSLSENVDDHFTQLCFSQHHQLQKPINLSQLLQNNTMSRLAECRPWWYVSKEILERILTTKNYGNVTHLLMSRLLPMNVTGKIEMNDSEIATKFDRLVDVCREKWPAAKYLFKYSSDYLTVN